MPILCFIVFAIMSAFALLLPSIMFFLENLGATKATATQVLAGYSFAQFVAGPFLGRLSDRVGRKPIILCGLFLSAGCYTYLTFFAVSVSTVAFGLVGAGLCSGIVAVSLAAVADITDPKDRSKNMGFIGASIGLAFTLGPALGAYLSSKEAMSVTISLSTAASAAVLGVGLLAAMRLPVRREVNHEQPKSVNNSFVKRLEPTVFTQPVLLLICVLMLLFTVSLSMMEPIMPYLVRDRYEWGPREMGFLFAYVGLILIIVQGKFIGPLTKRFGTKKLLKNGTILMAVGLLILILTPVSYGILLGLTLTSIGAALFNTSLLAIASLSAALKERGALLGTVQSMQALGRSFGPFLAGWLYQKAPATPLLAGFFAVVLVFLGATFLKKLNTNTSDLAKAK